MTVDDMAWPSLSSPTWPDTCATLHMWTQMVGKVRLALTPRVNHWWTDFNDFLITYDDVRRAASPRAALLDFLQRTYEAGAELGGWNRAELERAER